MIGCFGVQAYLAPECSPESERVFHLTNFSVTLSIPSFLSFCFYSSTVVVYSRPLYCAISHAMPLAAMQYGSYFVSEWTSCY